MQYITYINPPIRKQSLNITCKQNKSQQRHTQAQAQRFSSSVAPPSPPSPDLTPSGQGPSARATSPAHPLGASHFGALETTTHPRFHAALHRQSLDHFTPHAPHSQHRIEPDTAYPPRPLAQPSTLAASVHHHHRRRLTNNPTSPSLTRSNSLSSALPLFLSPHISREAPPRDPVGLKQGCRTRTSASGRTTRGWTS